MVWVERKWEIMAILNRDKSASVKSLAKWLYASEATIRRDLDKLVNEGLVKRSHGGAALLEGLKAEIPLYVRETEQQPAKDLIGHAAASLVSDGNILILDSSSTTYAMVRHLNDHGDLTILTNGAKTAITAGQMLHTGVYSTGGKLRENSLSYVGEGAKSFISSFRADLMFFSCRAVSFDDGLFDSSVEESELRREMLKHASKRILLVDGTKINAFSFCKICDTREIDVLITDAQLSADDASRLADMNIQYIHAAERGR